MIRALIGELPVWARRDHPILRHELGKTPPLSRGGRLLRALLVVILLALVGGAGALIATGMLTRPAGTNIVESVHAILYFPLLFVQFIAQSSAFALTADAVGEELRRQNWDHVRATEHGADIALRSRWLSVFYRLRGIIALMLVCRVLLIGLLLYDLTAFQGRYLDLLTFGITPEIPLPLAVILVALVMTAALMLPFAGIAFEAAWGLFISAYVHNRMLNNLLQFLAFLMRATLIALLLAAAWAYLQGTQSLPDPVGWLLMLLFGGAGDWGAAYLLLSRFAEVWATVPFGVFLGAALIAFAFVQWWLAERVVQLAVRRAQRG